MPEYKLVKIVSSTKPGKKLMAVFKNTKTGREKTTHFGAAGMMDYTKWYKKEGPEKANSRKSSYLARHGANQSWSDPTKAGTLSRFILWNKPTISASISDYKKRFF